MDGSNAQAVRRGGSSFGPGPRRGRDPEGGERSAWKGLCGPSGLNLDHSRIPDIQKMVYAVLTPLVEAVQDPIPISAFTQKASDLLLPVLERQQELSAHEFKSQWGRLNEFVCPELARRAGLGDSGYSREHKTVCIDLKVPSSSGASSPTTAATASAPHIAAMLTPITLTYVAPAVAGATPGAKAARMASATPSMSAASPAPLPPTPGGMPAPVSLQPGAGAVLVPVAAPPPAPCSYCQGPHSMKLCQDFHRMLTSIYQAGYQHGLVAAQQHAHVAAAQAQAAHHGGYEGQLQR